MRDGDSEAAMGANVTEPDGAESSGEALGLAAALRDERVGGWHDHRGATQRDAASATRVIGNEQQADQGHDEQADRVFRVEVRDVDAGGIGESRDAISGGDEEG